MAAGTTTRRTKKELLAEIAQLGQTVRALEERLDLLAQERARDEERIRHAEKLQRRLATSSERFELLVRLHKDLSSLNLDKIVEVCVTKIPYLLNAHYASVYLYDEEQRKLYLKKHSHQRALEHVIDVGERAGSLMAQVLSSRQVRVFADLDRVQNPVSDAAPTPGPERPHREQYASRSCIVAPLVAGDSVLGVLNLSDPIDGAPFTDAEDLRLVQQVAHMLAIGILNTRRFSRLEEQARTDSLTRLVNHQTFFEVLDKEVRRAGRYGGELTVVMIDVDGFKIANDNAGHLAGDHVLQEVARILSDSVRLTDTAARYGGDEFALVLPQSDLGAAAVAAARIRERVAAHSYQFQGRDLATTVSLGLAQHEADLGASELVRRADQALYRAKREGGNRIGFFEAGAIRIVEPATGPSAPARPAAKPARGGSRGGKSR